MQFIFCYRGGDLASLQENGGIAPGNHIIIQVVSLKWVEGSKDGVIVCSPESKHLINKTIIPVLKYFNAF